MVSKIEITFSQLFSSMGLAKNADSIKANLRVFP